MVIGDSKAGSVRYVTAVVVDLSLVEMSLFADGRVVMQCNSY